MGDAAGHLPERAQPLLLQDGLLRLAQIVVGVLQGDIELRLMGGQRDVLAQLPQKLAFAAAEAVRRTARGDQDAEHLAFDQQGRCHERTQPGARESLRKCELHLIVIGFVYQLSADATRKAVAADCDVRLLR